MIDGLTGRDYLRDSCACISAPARTVAPPEQPEPLAVEVELGGSDSRLPAEVWLPVELSGPVCEFEMGDQLREGSSWKAAK